MGAFLTQHGWRPLSQARGPRRRAWAGRPALSAVDPPTVLAGLP